MVSWCPNGEVVADFSEGPSICFVISAFTIPLDVVFLILLGIRLRNIAALMEFDYIDQVIKIQASFISGACVCMCIFSLVFGLVMDTAVSTLLYISLEVMVWLLAGVLVKIEGYRLALWPSPLLVAFFVLSCLFNIMIASITAQSADYPVSVVADTVCMVAGSFSAVLLSMLKIACRSEKEDMYRHSMEFSAANPVRSSHDVPPASLVLRTLKLDKLLGIEEDAQTRSMKTYEKSWWGTKTRNSGESSVSLLGGAMEFDPERHNSFDHSQSRRENAWFSFLRPSSQSSHRASTHRPDAYTYRQSASEDLRSLGAGGSGDLEDEVILSDAGSVASGLSSGSMSRALVQVLDQHKAKVHATNPLLEPRHAHKGMYAATTTRGKDDGWEAQRSQAGWHVAVQRWGVRNSRGRIESSEHSSSIDGRSSPVPVSPERGPHQDAEVEFEVEVSFRGLDSRADKGDDSAKRRGSVSGLQRSVVWRTSNELLTLHATLVSLQGDNAPRRPRLKSAQDHTLTNAELAQDMRSISLYLTSILRNHDACRVRPVQDFLGIHALVLAVQADASVPADGLTAVLPERDASLMEAAEMNASSQMSGQDKWRKLFMQMRIKLKPHDIAIHCRLFEGVISGEDVAGWLMKTTTSGGPATSAALAVARDRNEACTIGQELLSCGLLIAICAGFQEDPAELAEMHSLTESSDKAAPSPAAREQQLSDESTVFSKFSVMPGYVYRFPGKSGTAGSWSLFGGMVSVKIPAMTVCEENESTKYTRETMGFTIANNQVFTEDLDASESPSGGGASGGAGVGGGGGGTYVKYLIDIAHGGDGWQTSRRYREFEQLHKALVKEGVKPDATLPSKSLVKLSLSRGPTVDDNRRIGLEQYLRCAIQATVDADNDKALLVLALFLDDDFHNLFINNSEF